MLDSNQPSVPRRDPWNKRRLIGQKRPLKTKDVWSIRVRLQVERRARNLALFNLAINSKLRGCDLVRLQVDDVCAGVLRAAKRLPAGPTEGLCRVTPQIAALDGKRECAHPTCRALFRPWRPQSIFCSGACRQKAYRERKPKY
jgi:hypothetical protein